MRRANPYREAIRRILRDEQMARPGCALASSIGVDEDGRSYIHFSCLSHDNASWRYYIHVYLDTELAQETYPGSELSSRCPRRDQIRDAVRSVSPEKDSSAQASTLTPTHSDEECIEVPDETLS